jgi:hypothetical protein
VTRWSFEVIFDPGSPSSCVSLCVEPGFVSRDVLQVKGVGRRAVMCWR